MVPRRTPPKTQRAASQAGAPMEPVSEMAISIGGRGGAVPRHLRVY